MVSWKSKNPFAGGAEVFSWKTWVGVGAFGVIAGVGYVVIRSVAGMAEKAGNPFEEIQNRLAGLGA